ncbi:hypothetical protein [Herminiimonas sp. CN]|uniref:hypothetical protein n=1 Tax=Herminiimonas sp. CN TaxID=1349818 RepID=UPI00047371C2|nr:hypothetical protein [Herminiimonas sp. CN]
MSILDPRLWLALLLSHGLLFGTGYWRGDLVGAKSERATWQAKEAQRVTAEQKATLQAMENNTRLEQQQEIDKRKVINGHQTELAAIRAAYEYPAGRLRIASAVCNSVAAASQADRAGGADATAAAAVELPIEIEHDLRKLARDADEVTATARALQESMRISGCYAEISK